ncbi:membrane protein [Yersinia similis]|uniref:Membrane protein n=1 Tax=Yersinia similis TaxID=367190 RepID=A0ABN4CSC0_9GAMM|nr:hypothetical protein [Yersinia similis]AHK21544.1 membrane protein [Yersinia similis]CFQ49812.1 membrane protein [Yersinia similis]CNC23126.1 membrane protein [Yersinia similis]
MTNDEIEKKLLDKGFTEKNIQHMRKIISRDKTHKETYQSLLGSLKKRFLAGCVIVLILFAFTVPELVNQERTDFISIYITLALALFIVYIMAPMNLAWKAYRYLKKEG